MRQAVAWSVVLLGLCVGLSGAIAAVQAAPAKAPKVTIERNVSCKKLGITPAKLAVSVSRSESDTKRRSTQTNTIETRRDGQRLGQNAFKRTSITQGYPAVTTLTVTNRLPDEVILRADYEIELAWKGKMVPRIRHEKGDISLSGSDEDPATIRLEHNAVYYYQSIRWKNLRCDVAKAEPVEEKKQPKPRSRKEPSETAPAATDTERGKAGRADRQKETAPPATLPEDLEDDGELFDAPPVETPQYPVSSEPATPQEPVQKGNTIIFPDMENMPNPQQETEAEDAPPEWLRRMMQQ